MTNKEQRRLNDYLKLHMSKWNVWWLSGLNWGLPFGLSIILFGPVYSWIYYYAPQIFGDSLFTAISVTYFMSLLGLSVFFRERAVREKNKHKEYYESFVKYSQEGSGNGF